MSDANPTVLALIPDLMAEVRFTQAMRAAGIASEIVEPEAWPARLRQAAARDRGAPAPPDADSPAAAAVVDLTAPDAVRAVRAAVEAGLPTLAYGPHVDADLLGAARDSGATTVVPRGRFVREAAALVAGLLATGASEA